MSEEKELKKKVEEIVESKSKAEPLQLEETITESMRLKQENDAYEQQINRQAELTARAKMGGTAEAGQPEESQQDKDNKEAANIISTFED